MSSIRITGDQKKYSTKIGISFIYLFSYSPLSAKISENTNISDRSDFVLSSIPAWSADSGASCSITAYRFLCIVCAGLGDVYKLFFSRLGDDGPVVFIVTIFSLGFFCR